MILYDDTSRWKYDQTGTEEKPSDRKPINWEEQAKMVLYRIVFASVDKLGSNLNKKNLQNVIIATAEGMKKEVQDKSLFVFLDLLRNMKSMESLKYYQSFQYSLLQITHDKLFPDLSVQNPFFLYAPTLKQQVLLGYISYFFLITNLL
jgi:hypothetical protein